MKNTSTALWPRPFGYHRPRTEGYSPLISGEIVKVSSSRKTGWRATVMVDRAPMSITHCGTKRQAESVLAKMLETYTDIHYRSV